VLRMAKISIFNPWHTRVGCSFENHQVTQVVFYKDESEKVIKIFFLKK